jgi:hypothetical protein
MKKFSEKADKSADKKAGVKENSAADKKQDKKAGEKAPPFGKKGKD